MVLARPISSVTSFSSALDTNTNITFFTGCEENKTTQQFSLNSETSFKIRLHTVRDLFFRNLIKKKDVIDYYRCWVLHAEYMLLQRETTEPYKDTENRKTDFIAVKCAKRGNDVYRYRVRKSLSNVFNNLDDIVFFSIKDRNLKNIKTSAVSVTMTYDKKRCSLRDAWANVGKEFSSWLTKLRKRYGKISIFRTWEAFKNGYPHINVILFFHSVEFSVFRYYSKKNKKSTFRIRNKAAFSDWHSFVDVQAVSDLKKNVHYITKYITKELFNEKSSLTLAMLWIFKKRSFSISKDFMNKLMRLDSKKHNLSQLSLTNEKLTQITYIFLGIYSKTELEIDRNYWTVQIPSGVIEKFF